MNWKVLKERFPNSQPEIREYSSKTKSYSSRILIESFLKSKGYEIYGGFLNALKDYEKCKGNQ